MTSRSYEDQLKELTATVIDGRTKNVRYQQTQLLNLHAALSRKEDVICSAISTDTSGSNCEVAAEFFWTADVVRRLFESIDFEGDLENEYLVARNKDDLNRRCAIGLAVIRPTTHTRLYSIISVLATAVAAGNCVLLELEPTILALDPILREVITESLDQDAVKISSKKVDFSKLPTHIFVDQTNSLLRTIAVVDRTANIDAAANAIVTARQSFQGSSPFAPDLVIVNEFVKSRFIDSCTQIASHISGIKPRENVSSNSSADAKQVVRNAELKGEILSFGLPDFKILDIRDRSSKIVKEKIGGTFLPIISSTSLIDAVSLIEPNVTFSAGYLFADPPSVKFLGQYLDCNLAFANHIPFHLLIGPVAPLSSEPSLPHRYNTRMFTDARPQVVTQSFDGSSELSQALSAKFKSADAEKISLYIRNLAVQHLKAPKRPLGHAIGFFEQGILTGLGIFLITTVVPPFAYGGWTFAKYWYEIYNRK
ncbi:hypothetical protein G7Y89_g13219 [Cudoniella acicularis]|uniref:Aldehyde dehydrogenase domain-containing protein n=1 Tax=Cudoniella acicularis TaxID=354080 RepID=A0A8H4R9Q9_9HELO|nr:hypothetical protein G7Y89_g13219 [Cudoniella acicularis]